MINKIGSIHFTSSDELHTLGALYESMLREMRDAAGDSGEFYTPRPVVRFMTAVTDPSLGRRCSIQRPERRFLVEALSYMSHQVKDRWRRTVLQRPLCLAASRSPCLTCCAR